MIRQLIQHRISEAVARLQARQELPTGLPTSSIEVADPREASHGDFACNFALVAAKSAGLNPREMAENLKAELLGQDRELAKGITSPPVGEVGDPELAEGEPGEGASRMTHRASLFSSIDVAGPGFLNFRLTDGAWIQGLEWANERSDDLARPSPFALRPSPLRLNVEFVSVNPNGPITVGSGRGAAFGSTLCNVLEAAGHEVQREYYINDGTNSEQMRLFAESLRYYCLTRAGIDVAFPDRGYKGDYVDLIAETVTSTEYLDVLHEYESSLQQILDTQLKDLELDYARLASLHAGETPSNYEPDREDYLAEVIRRSQPQNSIEAVKHSIAIQQVEAANLERELDVVKHLIEIAKGAKQMAGELSQVWGSSVAQIPTIAHQMVAQHAMLKQQREDLERFATTFDTWFSEQSLHDSGKVEADVADLVAKGAADDRPIRRVLKLAKGGKIEDVEIVDQPNEEVDEDLHTEGSNGTTEQRNDQTTDHESDPSRITNHASQATLWLRSTKFADDMDRVLRRKDGRLTYIASDVAYHKDKFNRPANADKLITILGPDHHGYIGRLHAVVAALLEENASTPQRPDAPTPLTDLESKLYASPAERDACFAALEESKKRLEVIIFQIVRFVKEGKPAPMRKRDGNIYSLRDLMTEIGKDAAPNAMPEEQMVVGKDVARFFYLMRSHDTHMDFDIDLATKGTEENPVFYVQYAHARICSILKKAESELPSSSFAKNEEEPVEDKTPNAPTLQHPNALHPKESALIKKILDLPDEVVRCAADYGVHRLTTYAIELARTFHHFYDACRVIQPEDKETTRRRLEICRATRHALKGALDLLGVSAPERMERETGN